MRRLAGERPLPGALAVDQEVEQRPDEVCVAATVAAMPMIEGLSADELLAMPDHELDVLVLSGDPITFRSGTAEILGRFERRERRLVMELAHIEGGGEGVLPTLYALAHRYARTRGLGEVEWRVHALTCARPNLRLREILERRGFEVKDVPGTGEVYWKLDLVRGRDA